MLHSIFLIKYKEIVVKDSLKSWFASITGNLTNIAVPCYIRKSNLGQRSMKKVAPVSDAFFYSNCFAMYYRVRSYKNTSKAVGLLANIVPHHLPPVLPLSNCQESHSAVQKQQRLCSAIKS